jgi:predicted permease
MPNWKTEIRAYLRPLKLSAKREMEIVEELSLHLDDRYEDLVSRGLTPAEARRKGLAELNGNDMLRRELRRIEQPTRSEPVVFGARRMSMIGDLWQDIRYGLRMFSKNPGFTLIAVLMLALGIGANTAIFSLLDTVVFKMLPVKDPTSLVLLANADERRGASFSYPSYQDLRDRNQVFAGIIAYDGVALNLSDGSQTERAAGQLVSGNFFSVLGVNPFLGRAFSEEDDKTPGAHPVAILSHSFWQRRFAADPGLIGKTIHLNGVPFTLIGILPPDFFGVEVGLAPDVWVPMMMQVQLSGGRDRLRMRNNFWVRILARLRPGMNEQQAEAATDALYRQINEEAPGLSPGLRNFLSQQHIKLEPASKGLSSLRKQFKQPLLILMGFVGLVLLIACANVANLLLAQATARQKEIAVRLALGASRVRLVRQLLTESILLSLAGGLLSLLFAFWLTSILVSFMPNPQFALELRLDYRVLGFNLSLAVLTGILFGLAPAIRAARPDLMPTLKNEITTLGTGGRRFELRQVLAVLQVALSLVLLIGAGLFIRTLQNLKGIDLGFKAENVLLLSINPGLNGYTANQGRDFYAQLLERVRSLPGVQSASLADMPLMGGAWISGISIEGYHAQPGQDMSGRAKKVGSSFFETMGISLLRGRDFNEQDVQGGAKVAIINETLAREFWGDENPLGQRIGFGDGEGPEREIIAVIKDPKYRDLKENPARTLFVPLAHSLLPSSAPGRSEELTLHVRTASDPKGMIAAIQGEVRTLDKNLPVYNIRTFTELIAQSISQERLIATLSSLFGALALLLAAIGLYGVMAYSVLRRRREIGIRMALGAQPRDVLGMVLRQGLLLVLIGVGAGLIGAFALTRILSTLLYNVSTTDVLTFTGVPIFLIAVAVLACYVPARRATKVDPIVALRNE